MSASDDHHPRAAPGGALPPALAIAVLGRRYETAGGTERNLFELTRRLAGFGHSVHVYCLSVNCPPAPGVCVQRLPWAGFGRTAHLWNLAMRGPALAYRGKPDVVISFARALRQDIVRNGGGTHPQYLRQVAGSVSLPRRLFRALDPYHRSVLAIERRQYAPGHYVKIVANAPSVKRDIMETYGVPDADIQVIHNGVNTELFHPGNAAKFRRAVRARHGLPAEAPVVLFVGNGYRRKGLDHLLQAAAALKEGGLHLLIVGADAALPAYREQAAALGLADRACFVGPQAAMPEYYGAADFFTLPSLYEPFGHSTLEALACGLPVIGARRTGASDLLSPRLAEFTLEDPRDLPAFTARLARLLDPALRAALREEAVAISREFTLDANARAFEQLCREVVARKRQGAG